MVDKSWGEGTSSLRVRSNLSSADRAAERAKARTARGQERAASTAQRLEARSAARQAEAEVRETLRVERREAERRAAERDAHSPEARRIRSSGRKDVVREQRDTRAYTTTVDHGRIRELARRGASVTGLAGAFGVTVNQIEAALAAVD